MMQTVEYIARKSSLKYRPVADAFVFAPKGRLAFLQRWLWKALHKLKCLSVYQEPFEIVTRHSVDSKNFMSKLYEQNAICLRILVKKALLF